MSMQFYQMGRNYTLLCKLMFQLFMKTINKTHKLIKSTDHSALTVLYKGLRVNDHKVTILRNKTVLNLARSVSI